MQPVNDDMDNLFWQAADSYPLNTSGANFDKVRQQADAETTVPLKETRKKRYTWLLLLLLLPLAFLLKQYKTGPTPQYSQTKDNVVTPQHTNKEARITKADEATITKMQNEKDKKNAPVTKSINKAKKEHLKITKEKTQAVNNSPVTKTNRSTAKQHWSLLSHNKATQQVAAVSNTKERQHGVDKKAVFLASGNKSKSKKVSLLSADEYNKRTLQRLIDEANATIAKQKKTNSKRLVDSTLQPLATNNKKDSAMLARRDNAEDSTSKPLASRQIKTKTKTKPGIYIGIIAGPDISAVKTKQVNGPGYNLGFIAGYKTGRHLAFETGIIWNNKRYHAEGKDVSVERLGLQQHTTLLYLNGTCRMIEIPVSVRYRFNAKTANSLYIGAGISSYIMKKETYNYKSKRYNNEYYQKREYRNTATNWLSVMQLQAGYEINLKKGSSLRLEPYAKLPLQGIGIGKLRLSSGGLNIGYTAPIN